MALILANNASSTLSAPIVADDTEIVVATGTGSRFPSLSAGDWFPLVVVDAEGNIEVMRATARTGDVITVTRGQEGTTGLEFASGVRVDLRLTKAAMAEFALMPVPSASAKTSDFNVLATERNNTFLVNTGSGVVTATLPTLGSGDAGWECFFIKTNTGTNTLYIAPPSGTIQSGEVSGLAKTRRCIPGRKTSVMWTGSAFIAQRVEKDPIGTIKAVDTATLPVGYEYPMGQTLNTTNYPDYAAAKGSGVVLDLQGRAIFGKTDMDGTDNGLITGGTTIGATFGAQTVPILKGNLPDYNLLHDLNVSGSVEASHQVKSYGQTFGAADGANQAPQAVGAVNNVTFSFSAGVAGQIPLGGSGTELNKLPPGMILPFVIVVE